MKRRGKRIKGQGRGGRILLILAVIAALIFFVDANLRPVIESVAAHQVRVYATRIVNAAILAEVEREAPDYGDIVRMEQAGGGVTAIQTNIREVNRIKACVTDAVTRCLEELGVSSLYIPAGTLLGNEFTSGRGPLVEVRAYPAGYIQTDLTSQFTSAGINQTLHQIMLGVSVRVSAVIPGYSIHTEITTNYCIAETVIVGNIPESFTQINGDNAPLISKINDYAAP